MGARNALLAVLLWSTVASAFKISLRYLSPFQLLFYSFLTSAVFFHLVGHLAKRGSLGFSREDLPSAFLGLVLFLYYTVLFWAYRLLPAQEAQALNYTWPITLALLSVPLLGEKLDARKLLGLLIGFSGALVVATRGNVLGLNFSNPLGDSLAIASAFLWAIYWLLNVRDDRPVVRKMAWNLSFSALYSLFPLLLTGSPSAPLPGIAGAVYVGLFEMGVTYLLWHGAVEEDVALASNLAYLVPFLSLLFISLFVGERIEPSTLAGLLLIVTGIALGRGRSAGG